MGRIVLGIVVTTVVLYIWGSVFWGVSPLPYDALQQTTDDEQAQQMLLEYFPSYGTYLVPGINHEDEELNRLFEQGPVAMVHLQPGGPAMNMTTLIGGFVLDLAFVALLAGFFKVAGASEFRDFARLSLATAVVAVVLIDGGDIIWWQESFGWKAWTIIYNLTAFLIAGHLLGIFMKRKEGDVTT